VDGQHHTGKRQAAKFQMMRGHSSIKVTLDIYEHLGPDALHEVASKLDNLFAENQ
jgi:hypothetical protein